MRVFATTPPYFDYNWTVRGDLDPKILVKKLTEAFLKLDPANPEHKEIMALQRASKFIPTKAENYKGIEKAAQAAGSAEIGTINRRSGGRDTEGCAIGFSMSPDLSGLPVSVMNSFMSFRLEGVGSPTPTASRACAVSR